MTRSCFWAAWAAAVALCAPSFAAGIQITGGAVDRQVFQRGADDRADIALTGTADDAEAKRVEARVLTAKGAVSGLKWHGVATATRAWVEALEGSGTRLLDTRKTTPGLRALEKYAVRCGGGTNHRMGLSDAFLVKDNHADGCGSLWDATRRAADFRAMNRSLKRCLLEAEARTRDEVHQALEAGAERVLLDNMTVVAMREAIRDVKLWNEATGAGVTTEASGGMTIEKARKAARAGVDYVSVGAITHSVRAADVALDVKVAAARRGRR